MRNTIEISPPFRRRLPFRRGLILNAAGVSLVGLILAFNLGWLLTQDSGPVSGDLIVLLGGGYDGRAERAAELYKQGAAPRILITGFGDAPFYKAILEANGVPEKAILMESASRSTFQNVKFSLPLMRAIGARRVIIVTSWFHSRRAQACFRHLVPEMTFYSRPSYVNYGSPFAKGALVELLKIPGYWLVYGVSSVSV